MATVDQAKLGGVDEADEALVQQGRRAHAVAAALLATLGTAGIAAVDGEGCAAPGPGDVRSLVIHPASTTHFQRSDQRTTGS